MLNIFFLISLLVINLSAQSIILAEQNNTNDIAKARGHFNKLLQDNELLNKFNKSEKFSLKVKKKNNSYIISVESFQSDEDITTIYLTLKEFFPQAFISNDDLSSPTELTKGEDEFKKINTLYLAVIISLVVAGIVTLILFLIRINKIRHSHNSVIEKHHKLELFLTQTGERIHSITNEIVENKNQNILESDKENALDDIRNRLFNETRMLIYFLKLKSKKIKIIQENFNINTMLNNILGTLSSNFAGVKTELIFDIDHSMPKIITSDLLHLTEIMIELLQNSIRQTPDTQVKFSMTLLQKDRLFFEISDTSKKICQEDIKNIFIPTYKEDGTPERLSLYVAHELTTLLGGTLKAKKAIPCGLIIECEIPVVNPFPDEFRKYRVPDLSYIRKRVLLCENNIDAAKAIEKMLNYFQYVVDILPCNKSLSEHANMLSYDLIMGDIVNLSTVDIYTIEKYRKKHSIKVVNLCNIFQEEKKKECDYIDAWLKKPLSQGRLYDLIVLLFDEDGEISMNSKAKNSVDNMKILSTQEIEKLKGITAVNLKKFKNSHILVADDSSIDQKILQHMLLLGDMKITLAKNGADALERLYASGIRYDLVFMDISMPVMDGYEAMRHIRESDRFAFLPLVATTSVTLESEIEKIFRYGANGYIEKPLTISALYATLDFFLSNESKNKVEPSTKQNYPKKPLRNIVGLDYNRGIRNTNNDAILYSEVLSEFVLAYGESSKVFQRMLDENRHQQLKRLCLDLRSLTNVIGAYDMFSVVDSIYKQYIYNNIHLIPKYAENYDKELVKLLKAIEEFRSLKPR